MKKKQTPTGQGRAPQKKQHTPNCKNRQGKEQGPAILPVRPCGIPVALKNCDQWGVWRREERDGAITKVPYDVHTGRRAKSNDPTTWSSFDDALAAYEHGGGRYDGIVFVFSKDDPYCGADLDDCRDPTTGKVKNWARKIIADFGTYAEVSPSGTGVKLYCRGSLPTERTGTRRPFKGGAVEMYQFSRFFVVTGRRLLSTPRKLVECGTQLQRLWRKINPPPRPAASKPPRPGLGISPATYEGIGVPPDVDDGTLLARVRQSKRAEEFEALWIGHWGGRYLSQSEADLALCGMLAFWTGPQPDRLDRLFRQSRLYRDKWDEVHHHDERTYGEATVETVLAQRGTADYFNWQRDVDLASIARLCNPVGPIGREFRKRITNQRYKER